MENKSPGWGTRRRAFLRGGAAAAGGLAATAALEALSGRLIRAATGGGEPGPGSRGSLLSPRVGAEGEISDPTPVLPPSPDYGPLVLARDETTGLPLLFLPRGFRYTTFGWTDDLMLGGAPTPGAHDGMAALPVRRGRVRLIRNHEIEFGPAFGPAGSNYDMRAGGGTVTLEFDTQRGAFLGASPSLGGTMRNCAGGPTPWGSWLTCEEIDITTGRPHGFVFEVPGSAPAAPEPLRAMGRFVHEAVAVDPSTGIVYQTEDRSSAGLYRFLPDIPGVLSHGGRLQMLAVAGAPRLDTRTGRTPDQRLPVEWVDVADPGSSVFDQGLDGGGAIFGRLEGAWFGAGRLYFAATDAGDAAAGQIWEYDPPSEQLRLVLESPHPDALKSPDNLCVSPRGGLILCEDGGAPERLQGLTQDGRLFGFAENHVVLDGERNGIVGDYRWAEFAGATFSPGGRWLFFNIQTPGITFAVTGPWGRGGL